MIIVVNKDLKIRIFRTMWWWYLYI